MMLVNLSHILNNTSIMEGSPSRMGAVVVGRSCCFSTHSEVTFNHITDLWLVLLITSLIMLAKEKTYSKSECV